MKRIASAAMLLAALIFAGMIGALRAADQNQGGEPAKPAPRMMCQDRFDTMDTNRDGTVTKEEFMAVRHPKGHSEEVFKSRDTNGDGALTKDEFCAGRGMGRGMGQGRAPQ
ncbi:MAG: EF-hand domain-containing protein [Syntrophobacteraceae bacterium]